MYELSKEALGLASRERDTVTTHTHYISVSHVTISRKS